MSFLNNGGVATLWSKFVGYLTGSHVKTSAIAGASDVDAALTQLDNKKVNVAQGAENEECYLVVDDSGNLVLRDVPVHLGIPGEWNRFGVVRILRSNAAQDTFTVTIKKEGDTFEPDCTYAGSVHLYSGGDEYVSDIDLCMYVETNAGTDRLVFMNHILMPGGIFRFMWEIDLVGDFVRVVFSTSDAAASIESLFTSGTVSRLDFIIRKVQTEPWY